MLENGRPLSAPSQKEDSVTFCLDIRRLLTRRSGLLARWIIQDEPQVDDAIVWRTLDRLSGADMISFDRPSRAALPYLYDESDFGDWLSSYALRKSWRSTSP